MRFIFISILIFVFSLIAPRSVNAAPSPDSLIKLSCPAGSKLDNPCRAVYYYGGDSRRHVFPSEKVYFTWYTDFSKVQIVSPAVLSSIPLGTNVTSRPGARMVKFQTDAKTYAVALSGTLRWVKTEELARSLYDSDWNTKIDDVSDAFFGNYRFGADINSSSDFDPVALLDAAQIINDDLPITRRQVAVTINSGAFSVELIKLQQERVSMITDTAEGRDCDNNCLAKSLADYAALSFADAGMHGSYFCPAEYPSCAGKTNTFLSPFFDSNDRVMVNGSSLLVHQGPMLSYGADGAYRFFHRTKDFGPSVAAFEAAHGTMLAGAASNYPSLVENGAVIVESEPRLEEEMRTLGTRGAIGLDKYFIYLAVVRNTSVPDLAEIMKALGVTHAFNLDGGGSAALYFDGKYVFGPGRNLPNAILFKLK